MRKNNTGYAYRQNRVFLSYKESCFSFTGYKMDLLLQEVDKMIKTCFENVKAKTPLVHNITNYVTVNDVANVLLACGGSPIMADDIDDVEDITSICGGLNINIGTLNKHTIPSMFAAGKKANELGHAVLLDPVGADSIKAFKRDKI